MWPVGKIFRRTSSAMKKASLVSSACLTPLYCSIAAGLASTTGYFSARNPSTSQYQLYVDSTATVSSRFLKGARNFATSLRSQGSFWLATRLPSVSRMPTTTLLLCRSIPAITFFIGRLLGLVLLFIYVSTERQLFYREATASLNHQSP